MKPNHALTRLTTLAALAILALTPAARAASVPIVNAGFEDPVLSDGDYTGGISGWTQIAGGDIGVWNLTTAEFLTEAPEGLNAAYLYYVSTNGMGLGQVLSEPFQTNVPYVLTVQVGLSLYDTDPGYQVQLLAGGTVIAEDNNTLTLDQGEWKTSTVTYTYNPAHSALVGQPLEIRLLGKSPASQMVFDDVQLAYTPSGDVTAPTLAGSGIVDDKAGGPVEIYTLVTYTVTFSEAMNASTVTAADFGNAGSATVTIGTVAETAPGVFTVQATPTSAGTLQLRVNAGAELKDPAGNALDTTSAIPDNTTITVTEPALLPPGNTGTGGTITYTDTNGLNPRPAAPYAGGYVVHTFTTTGNDTLYIPVGATADVLVVAGGGAGGYDYTGSDQAGGGGGAGGLIQSTGVAVSVGYTAVTVGAGGTNACDSGADSVFGAITAKGGGGGGRGGVTNGKSGGSGGGGYGGYGPNAGGVGTVGQGRNGAAGGGQWYDPGGGGGGAGAAGNVAVGGAGVSNAISGSNVWYAGGGGGGVYEWPGDYPNSGGQGGGGRGGNKAAWGESVAYQATDGAPNTGGGGGGGGENGASPAHGKGGSGIVIVRYPYSAGGGFESWKTVNGATGQTPGDDHDDDGVSNGVEYFLVGPTGNSTGFTALPSVSNTSGVLSVTWTKDATYPGTYGTHFVVETSDSLIGAWNPEASPGNVTITGNEVKYTFPAPLGAKKFARLKVTGP